MKAKQEYLNNNNHKHDKSTITKTYTKMKLKSNFLIPVHLYHITHTVETDQ